ncbi:MAG: response regulator [Syntrophales bacterium]|jgi:response regulator RpfG family c-di-GMP phosphodiesterase|nr:response regulator [Syntrophales bacterium]
MANILIVDDEIETCKALNMFLSFKGYECQMAHTGDQALEIMRGYRIDLVLMDVMMPGMNGFEACRIIKNDELLKAIPVIMLTALSEKKDRIEGIEAGADDFINKPIDHSEVLARVRMLLKLKDANDLLSHAFADIQSLIVYGEQTFNSFTSADFDFMSKIDGIVERIIRKESSIAHKPESVVVGYENERGSWSWYHYESVSHSLKRSELGGNIRQSLESVWKEESQIGFLNQKDIALPEFSLFIKELQSQNIKIKNIVYSLSRGLCIVNLNHDREVGKYDAAILNSMVTICDSLRYLARQVQETEEAFAYTIQALARASEVNDEDTGQHILRVGEYAGFIAVSLGLPERLTQMIRQQAPLHDVGKLYIPASILKKPAKLTDDEMKIIELHPSYGAKIIGEQPRLEVARRIALTHHERWDGSGYPGGLRGVEIPIEGRIVALADQYDALRNRRAYKPAFTHARVFEILDKGDGRTAPSHFDPAVLAIFLKFDKEFEDIYEHMQD